MVAAVIRGKTFVEPRGDTEIAVGDHVVLHSGQVLSVVGAQDAADAALLRTGTHPPSVRSGD